MEKKLAKSSNYIKFNLKEGKTGVGYKTVPSVLCFYSLAAADTLHLCTFTPELLIQPAQLIFIFLCSITLQPGRPLQAAAAAAPAHKHNLQVDKGQSSSFMCDEGGATKTAVSASVCDLTADCPSACHGLPLGNICSLP